MADHHLLIYVLSLDTTSEEHKSQAYESFSNPCRVILILHQTRHVVIVLHTKHKKIIQALRLVMSLLLCHSYVSGLSTAAVTTETTTTTSKTATTPTAGLRKSIKMNYCLIYVLSSINQNS